MQLHSFLLPFKELIEHKFGMAFDENRADQLLEILQTRLDELKSTPAAYMKLLNESEKEWEQLAVRLSVPETYFFRHPDQWNAFVETVMPERMEARRTAKKLRILSAGCASGEEAFTAAIYLQEKFPELATWDIQIHGFDINSAMLQKATGGIYSSWALRVTPLHIKTKYFTQNGNQFRLHDSVRAAAGFTAANLMDFYRREWNENFDVVFFRNVLIYFSPVAAARAISQIARVTAPGGFLFLGPAENLRGISQEYNLCHSQESFYYKRRKNLIGDLPASEIPNLPEWHDAPQFPHEPAFVPAVNESTQWYEDILRSARRVQSITAVQDISAATPLKPAVEPAAAAKIPAAKATSAINTISKSKDQHGQVLRLLAEEKFEEALQELSANAPENNDADTLLIRAILLMNTRRVEEARQLCQTLLSRDEMNAGAHYLMALCSEQSKDIAKAIEHDEIATYLDPTFAMPYLHRALLAKQSRNWRLARHLFDRALVLLNYEEPSRVLLFGGGFHRAALHDLCRRELAFLEKVN